jgi:hypothetical protein
MKSGDLSRERESREQFVWLNRRYGETETHRSRSAITPSIRADSRQHEMMEAASTSVGCHPWSASTLGSQTAGPGGLSDGAVCPGGGGTSASAGLEGSQALGEASRLCGMTRSRQAPWKVAPVNSAIGALP